MQVRSGNSSNRPGKRPQLLRTGLYKIISIIIGVELNRIAANGDNRISAEDDNRIVFISNFLMPRITATGDTRITADGNARVAYG
jgi:hypothetical protein